jgi:CRISPR/Cas system-associated exonuclease Cas4 (RecB family)
MTLVIKYQNALFTFSASSHDRPTEFIACPEQSLSRSYLTRLKIKFIPSMSTRYSSYYLVRTSDGIVPLEAKSTKCPAGGSPYDSHVMQLAAYCLLVESILGAEVPYGVIKYSDREIIVDYTEGLRDELITLLEGMRAAREAEDVHRSHLDIRRCSKCSMREVCTESLA